MIGGLDWRTPPTVAVALLVVMASLGAGCAKAADRTEDASPGSSFSTSAPSPTTASSTVPPTSSSTSSSTSTSVEPTSTTTVQAPAVITPPCPPTLQDGEPFYTYAAACSGEWAVVLEANCTSGHSTGFIFRAADGRWQPVGAPGAFNGWPAPAAALIAAGVPEPDAAKFAAAPDRPSSSNCDTWVAP